MSTPPVLSNQQALILIAVNCREGATKAQIMNLLTACEQHELITSLLLKGSLLVECYDKNDQPVFQIRAEDAHALTIGAYKPVDNV